MTKKYKINGQELTIKEYNELYYKGQHPTLIKLQELYDELFGCYGTGSATENDKSQKVNRNLYADWKKSVDAYYKAVGQNYPEIWRVELGHSRDDDETKTLASLAKSEKLVQMAQQAVNLGEQLKLQRDATGNVYNKEPHLPSPLPYDKQKILAQQLVKVKLAAIEEINQALNQDPKITTEELAGENQSWAANIEHAMLDAKEVNDIKDRVLTDITNKRQTKIEQNKGKKRKREDHEEDTQNDNPDKKPRISNADKDNYNSLRSAVLDEVKENELKNGVKIAVKLEGEAEYSDEKQRTNWEEELIKRNPQLYRDTIIDALQERINDSGVSMSELSEDTKKLMRSEITNLDEFKVIKDRTIKEIGEVGAKKKWTDLIEKAQNLLDKAKQKVSEQIKKDIKTVQSQIKSLKSGTNAYLTSFYQNDKVNVEKLEQDLSSYLTTTQTEPEGTPWGIIIPISLAAVFFIGVIATVIVRKRKQWGKK